MSDKSISVLMEFVVFLCIGSLGEVVGKVIVSLHFVPHPHHECPGASEVRGQSADRFDSIFLNNRFTAWATPEHGI